MADLVLDRRISGKAFVGQYLTAIVIGAAIAAVPFLAGGALSWLFWLVAPVPLLGVVALSQLTRAGTFYRLYGDRLEVERGIFTRRIENVELFRIRDVGLHQGLYGRLANFGDVYLHSTDSSAPDLHIQGIDAPKEFYQQLRELVSSSRAASRTLIVEEGQTIPEP